MKYMILLLLCSGCATSPLERYVKHHKSGAEDNAKFTAQDDANLAALCEAEPNRCGPALLVVQDCRRVNVSGPGYEKDVDTLCTQSKRAKILTDRFYSVRSNKEYEEMDVNQK